MRADEEWHVRIDDGVPEGDPCVDGHFPGQPIVPGAILVAHAARVVEDAGFELARIRRLKFLHPLRPGQSFTISVARKPDSSEISWHDNDTVFARARVEIHSDD